MTTWHPVVGRETKRERGGALNQKERRPRREGGKARTGEEKNIKENRGKKERKERKEERKGKKKEKKEEEEEEKRKETELASCSGRTRTRGRVMAYGFCPDFG